MGAVVIWFSFFVWQHPTPPLPYGGVFFSLVCPRGMGGNAAVSLILSTIPDAAVAIRRRFLFPCLP
nr:MAG TPA: hypothetical protein [Microviridae sp.]